MNDLEHYIKAFSSLHTAKIKGFRAPHKAVLLLSVIDLVEEGVISSPCIELSDPLNRKFKYLWQRYLGHSSIFTADITKPYFHMQHESFWKLVEHDEWIQSRAAESSPYITGSKARKNLPNGSYSIQAMRKNFAYAEIDHQLFAWLQHAEVRSMLRVLLINTYLSDQPSQTMPIFSLLLLAWPLLSLAA